MSESLLLTWNWKTDTIRKLLLERQEILGISAEWFFSVSRLPFSQIAILAIVMRGTSFDHLRCKPI